MRIGIIKAAKLSPATLEDIMELCDRAYGEDLRPGYRTFDSPVHVVGRVAGRIVSHALWVTRWLEPGEMRPLKTAYVEAVATDPSFQRRGYASLLMRRVIEAVSSFDLAALSSSDDGRLLYERLGWQLWEGPLYIRTAAGPVATPDEVVMIHRLPGTPSLDTTALLSAEWREGEVW